MQTTCSFGMLIRNMETEEGWKNFDLAIDQLKMIDENEQEWLDIGGDIFSYLCVSPDRSKEQR